MSKGPKKQHKPIVTEQNLNFVLFDIGCGDGNRSYKWLSKDKVAHVFCFDPLEECMIKAKNKATDKIIIGRMHPVQAAVSSLSGSALLNIANDMSSCSLLSFDDVNAWKYPPGKPCFKSLDFREVPLIRMDKFMDEKRIARIQFCRIETQGTAIDVLQSFGKRIKDVSEFAIKVHVTDFDVYKGQTKKQDLLQFMNVHGFSIYGIQPYSRDQEEIIWFVNKLYAKQALRHLDYVNSNLAVRK